MEDVIVGFHDTAKSAKMTKKNVCLKGGRWPVVLTLPHKKYNQLPQQKLTKKSTGSPKTQKTTRVPRGDLLCSNRADGEQNMRWELRFGDQEEGLDGRGELQSCIEGGTKREGCPKTQKTETRARKN